MIRVSLARRKFLSKLIILGLAGTPAMRALSADSQDKQFPEKCFERLKELIHSKNSASIIGNSYLRVRPDEKDPRLLAKLICKSISAREPGNVDNDDDFKRIVKSAVEDDFASDRVVELNRIVFSVTEVRLYALIALLD